MSDPNAKSVENEKSKNEDATQLDKKKEYDIDEFNADQNEFNPDNLDLDNDVTVWS